MDFRTDKLLHGGDYNPEQWLKRPDILAKDIDMLEESGCNVVSPWSSLSVLKSIPILLLILYFQSFSFSLSYLILYPISKHTILAAHYFSQSKQSDFDFILLTGYSLQLLQAPANAKDKKHNRHIY